MNHTVDIIIPTYNNPILLGQCLNSILLHTQARESMRIIVINNGEKNIDKAVTEHPFVKIIEAGKNLGWEGGLKLGLEHSTAPFVCFMNDDTYIPFASNLWLARCLSEFKNSNIAAAGPSSNVVRGAQNIFLDQFGGYHSPYAPFLIGFCIFVRKSDLEAAGGIDDSLPGGDDFDLSIRLRKLGKKLVICRDVFVFHHGFKTGERVRGGPDRPGGWNSQEMSEKTNIALIQKHGFQEFTNCNFGVCENPESKAQPSRENEIEVVKSMIKPGVIYDLGCGASKTVPEAIGIDRVPIGDRIPNLEGEKSVAEIQADVTEELPVPDGSADTIVTRHVLEHVVDPIDAIEKWIKKLKPDGRLIICVPDERLGLTIPMNPEHRHAYTPESLSKLIRLMGLNPVQVREDYNGISFAMAIEKTLIQKAEAA